MSLVAAGTGWMFEFQDSQVAEVLVTGGAAGEQAVVVCFSTACVSAEGVSAGQRAEAGYLLGLDLVLACGHLVQRDPACLGLVSEGTLQWCVPVGLLLAGQGVQTWRRLPVPFESPPSLASGGFTLTLGLANGAMLVVQATQVRLRATAGTRFVESFAC
jgi:hypothetical protein